ncbi:MAG: hypothetical protein JWQ40_3362 [Segetibacter sp.]|nr:hypothetical protein [Segetibacter sp.]
MKLLRLTSLLIFAFALITSCKKPFPNQTRYIPKSAAFVATINTKALQGKLQKNQAAIENILKSVNGSDTSVTKGKQEWEDLKASGIDLNENVYLAVVQKGGGMSMGEGAMISSGIGTLKDEGKLEAYIQKKQPGSEVKKEKDYSYSTMQGNKMIAWGKDVVIMMFYQKSFANQMELDTTTGAYNFKAPVNAAADMKVEMDSYFNLKEEQSVASIPEFRDLMQDKSDMSMWVNSASSIDNLPLPLPKLKDLLANSFTAATLNFEDGQITVNSKSYYSKELRDLLNNYTAPDANLALIENYPSSNINGFSVFSFNPDFFNGLVNYLEVGAMVDGTLTKMMGSNYTLQEALKALKGDIAVVVSDFASDSTRGTRNNIIPKMKMVVNITIGDKVQMNRLLDKVVEMRLLVKDNTGYHLNPSMQQTGLRLSVDDKNLLFSTDESTMDQYRAKSGKAVFKNDVMDEFKGKSLVAYVDLEGILNGVVAENGGDLSKVLPKAKETFKDVIAYTEKFTGKSVEGHYELRFKNEKENSLTSLLGFIEVASKNVHWGNMRINGQDVMADSPSVAIPVIPR